MWDLGGRAALSRGEWSPAGLGEKKLVKRSREKTERFILTERKFVEGRQRLRRRGASLSVIGGRKKREGARKRKEPWKIAISGRRLRLLVERKRQPLKKGEGEWNLGVVSSSKR